MRGRFTNQTCNDAVQDVFFTDEKAARITSALDKLHDSLNCYCPTADDIGAAWVNDRIEGAFFRGNADELLEQHPQGIETQLRAMDRIGIIAL